MVGGGVAMMGGCRGWVSWVGVVGGHHGWASWVWVVMVVVEEEGGCCLLTCLLTPKSSIGKCECLIWVVGHGTQNIFKSFYYLLMVAWYRC